MTGFEAELADLLAAELGVRAQFFQGPWQNLPALLNTDQIDIVLNGYELTRARAGKMQHTRPYYIYQLVLLGRPDNPRLARWDDLQEAAWQPQAQDRRAGRLRRAHVPERALRRHGRHHRLRRDDRRHARGGNRQARRHAGRSAGRDVLSRSLRRAGRNRPARGPRLLRHLPARARHGCADALDRAIDKLLVGGDLQRLYRKYQTLERHPGAIAHAGRRHRRRPGHSGHRPARLGSDSQPGADPAGSGRHDHFAGLPGDAAGDGLGIARGPGPHVWPAAAEVADDRLRRNLARHAADAAAVRDLFSAAGNRHSHRGLLGRHRGPGDQLLGLRGRRTIAPACRPIPRGQMEAALALGMRLPWPCGGSSCRRPCGS